MGEWNRGGNSNRPGAHGIRLTGSAELYRDATTGRGLLSTLSLAVGPEGRERFPDERPVGGSNQRKLTSDDVVAAFLLRWDSGLGGLGRLEAAECRIRIMGGETAKWNAVAPTD